MENNEIFFWQAAGSQGVLMLQVKLYQSVIEDVIAGVRDSFLDEGVDEQVLQELKQIWEAKLASSKAVEPAAEPPEPQPPTLASQRETARNNAAKAGELFTDYLQAARINIQCLMLRWMLRRFLR